MIPVPTSFYAGPPDRVGDEGHGPSTFLSSKILSLFQILNHPFSKIFQVFLEIKSFFVISHHPHPKIVSSSPFMLVTKFKI
jgi:hypothetical protein